MYQALLFSLSSQRNKEAKKNNAWSQVTWKTDDFSSPFQYQWHWGRLTLYDLLEESVRHMFSLKNRSGQKIIECKPACGNLAF